MFERLPRRETAILLVVCVVVLALARPAPRRGRDDARTGAAGRRARRRSRPRRCFVATRRGSSSTSSAPCAAPGLVRLAEGSRVADALERAGGPTRRADLALVNLAAPVADGQQVVVPARVSQTGGAVGAAAGGGGQGEPRERDARATRRAARASVRSRLRRSSTGARATGRCVLSTISMRFPESALPASSSSATS